MTDIEDLINRVVKHRDDRDWKQFHNPKDVGISLMLEAAEVMEHFQWKNKEEMEDHIRTHREEIGEELADVLYWILLASNDMDIDIAEAFEKKMKKNEQKYPVDKFKGNHKKYNQI